MSGICHVRAIDSRGPTGQSCVREVAAGNPTPAPTPSRTLPANSKGEVCMKSAKLKCITAIALLVALAIPVSLAAQEHPTQHHHYKLKDIGTLGGPNIWFNWSGYADHLLGSNGTVTGGADTSTVDPFCWNKPD